MPAVTWVDRLCQGLRKSQITTISAILAALFHCNSAVLADVSRAMAHQTGVAMDHTVKRLHRFLANAGVNREVLYANITRYVWKRIRHWKIVPIALDWSYCESRENWQILAASVIVRGRGIPILIWAFPKSDFGLFGSQNKVELAFVTELHRLLEPHQRPNQTIVILADRGFPRPCIFQHIEKLGWDYVIRVKSNVYVSTESESFILRSLSLQPGEVRAYRNIAYRRDGVVKIRRLVVTRAPADKEKNLDPWFLVSSLPRQAAKIIELYSLRFTIEEDFRTIKSNMGFKDCRIRKLEHYRQFLMLLVLVAIFAFMVGFACHQKPSLARLFTRRRKGKLDTSITVCGLHLLRHRLESIIYMDKIDKLPAPI